MSHPDRYSIGSMNVTGGAIFGDGGTITNNYNDAASPPSAPAAAPPGLSRTLLLTVTAAEEAAVIRAVTALTRTTPADRFLPTQTVTALGTVSRSEVLLSRVGQGTQTPHSAGPATAELIQAIKPDCIVLVGICYGLRGPAPHGSQYYGDILAADLLYVAAHHKRAEVLTERGGAVHPSPKLINRFTRASSTWPGPARVHIGPMISESVLVNDPGYRDELRARFPEAIGGEMEAAGVYPFATRAKVEWGMVKAICDFASHKTDDHHLLAAANAAEFVAHTLRSGALDPA
ncbi:hypothetical protein Cs7R123_11180 [Catellatospora sp. TT07R-123]|uniref:5'-methylthioadenosine/S-adenosylhomocysteine nucleosidase family protein n=1 Tax=Catellatospora sp. TT07R-123 TaxID=2733863 RepID=UPI001AFD305B|nr:hypothetical protein [Catellatospora sp. TT07R-123]GHJ43776.1 hypothetical protein Cs7R123_11180 [Catellatospora sp. TT07R-123]